MTDRAKQMEAAAIERRTPCATLEAAVRKLLHNVDTVCPVVDPWLLDYLDALRGALEAEPAQENARCSQCGFTGPHGHTHQGKPSAPTQDSASGEPELNHDDLFSFIEDESIIRYIAGICGRLGVDKCTCIAIGDIARKANGHPQFNDEHAAGRAEMAAEVRAVVLGAIATLEMKNDVLPIFATVKMRALLAKLPEADDAQPSDQ